MTVSEMKNKQKTMDGINVRLDTTEVKMSEFEGLTIETTPNKTTQRKRNSSK